MEDLSYLSEAQCLALDKLTTLVGIKQINYCGEAIGKFGVGRFETLCQSKNVAL